MDRNEALEILRSHLEDTADPEFENYDTDESVEDYANEVVDHLSDEDDNEVAEAIRVLADSDWLFSDQD